MKPIEGGTYRINNKMLEDLKVGILGENAWNLAGFIANAIEKKLIYHLI